MGILLGILSTIGIILLIILLVVLALIALILFLPFVYRARVVKRDELFAQGSVRWLFGAVSFKFSFKDKKFDYTLRVFGIPLHKLLNKDKKGKKSKTSAQQEFQPAKKQPTIKPGQVTVEFDAPTDDPEYRIPLKEAQERTRHERGKIRRLKEDEAFEEERKPSFFEKLISKIKLTFKKICDTLRKVKDILNLIGKVKGILIKLIRSIMPKKIKGYIDFGFDDPSATGKLLAVLGMLCIPIPKDLKLTPDFQEQKFECDVKLSGRIFIIVILVYAIKLLMIPEVKAILGEALHGKDSDKKNSNKKNKKHNKNKKTRKKAGKKAKST